MEIFSWSIWGLVMQDQNWGLHYHVVWSLSHAPPGESLWLSNFIKKKKPTWWTFLSLIISFDRFLKERLQGPIIIHERVYQFISSSEELRFTTPHPNIILKKIFLIKWTPLIFVWPTCVANIPYSYGICNFFLNRQF